MPATPLHANLAVDALITNTMRGIHISSSQLLIIGTLWYCTKCQSEDNNPYFLFRSQQLIGLEHLIYKPECPSCRNQFLIMKTFKFILEIDPTL